MKPDTLQFLKTRISRTIRITTTEQETLIATVQVVDEKEKYVIYDLLSTNQPERYERMKIPAQSTGLTPFEFIERAEDIE